MIIDSFISILIIICGLIFILLLFLLILVCNCVLLFKYQKNVEEYRVKPSSLILKEALMLLDLKVFMFTNLLLYFFII